MCMKIFHLGIKSSANPCRMFSCVTWSQPTKALSKAGCQFKSYLSWLHTWARCWGFSELQNHGEEGFCISCVLTPALKLLRFIASEQCHELAWKYPKRIVYWQCALLCHGLVPFVRSGGLCTISFPGHSEEKSMRQT
jgi:hypothetical protein